VSGFNLPYPWKPSHPHGASRLSLNGSRTWLFRSSCATVTYISCHILSSSSCLYLHVLGTIAEREHRKWESAPPLPNNPYSPENINKRLSRQSTGFSSRSSSVASMWVLAGWVWNVTEPVPKPKSILHADSKGRLSVLCNFSNVMPYCTVCHMLDSVWQIQGNSQFPVPVSKADIVIMCYFCTKFWICVCIQGVTGGKDQTSGGCSLC